MNCTGQKSTVVLYVPLLTIVHCAVQYSKKQSVLLLMPVNCKVQHSTVQLYYTSIKVCALYDTVKNSCAVCTSIYVCLLYVTVKK